MTEVTKITLYCLISAHLALLFACEENDRHTTQIDEDKCIGVLCEPCPPSLSLTISDAAGQPVGGLSFDLEGINCTDGTNATHCSGQFDPESHDIEISAPGFISQSVTVEVLEPSEDHSCCGACPYGCADVVLERENCLDVLCGACPPPVTLYVSDSEDGDAIGDIAFGDFTNFDCSQSNGETVCYLYVYEAGELNLTITAPGYEDHALSLDLQDSGETGCCVCRVQQYETSVAMTPI